MTRSASWESSQSGRVTDVARRAEPELPRLALLALGGAAGRREQRTVKRAVVAMRRRPLDGPGVDVEALGAGLRAGTAFYEGAAAAVPPGQRPAVCFAAALIDAALGAQQEDATSMTPFELLVTDFLLAQACLLLARGTSPSRQISFARVIERSAAATATDAGEQPLRDWLVAAIGGEAPAPRRADPVAVDGDGGAALLEDELRAALLGDPPAVGDPMSRLIGAGGKRLRPRLALATGRSGAGTVSRDAVAYGIAIELTHNATLVHDDYIDGSHFRRNRPTVAAAEGSRAAVAVGTYYFARAARGIAELGRPPVAITFSSSVRALCVSQLEELCQRGSFPGDRRSYLLVVRGKTAALFAAASAGGAQCADLPPATVARMRRYGDLLGVAFQMIDDLIDFSDASGKPVGQDIRDRTVSLPLSYALEDRRAGPELLRILNAPDGEIDVRRAVDLVAATDALDRVRREAVDHADRAVRVLARDGLDRELPDLVELAHAAVARTA